MHKNKTKCLKRLLSLQLIGFISLSCLVNAKAQEIAKETINTIETSYLDPKDELKDYILDTGDTLSIEFIKTPDLSGSFTINEEGEIYFERLKNTFVRGLTISELTSLLEKRYEEFLVSPEIHIRIITFKPIRVAVRGEVRQPSIIKFNSFTSSNEVVIDDQLKVESSILSNQKSNNIPNIEFNSNGAYSNQIKNRSDFVTTISNAIRKAGGLTSYSDISRIEIIRDVPISNGGGKKKAIIDFTPYTENSQTNIDLRLFDGDTIYIPRQKKLDPNITRLSILSGLSPKFINITITGKIENPGVVKIPLEGTLSDVMNLSGPRKPLSGKIFLIRYRKDGSLLRKEINYQAKAIPGSSKNPFLIAGDLITVKNSILGRTSGTIKAFTEPFVGIYSTKELLENLNGN